MTTEQMLKIDGTWTAEQLGELTNSELTQVYNFNVSEDKQIKKFRTKEQAIERCLKVLADKVVAVETTETQVIDEQTEGYIRVIRGETTVLPSTAVDPNLAPATITVTEEKKTRRTPVKGVVKLCRQLLSENLSDSSITAAIQGKYVREGGYDEKTAKSSAQTILADTKKRLLAEQKPTLDEALQAAAS